MVEYEIMLLCDPKEDYENIKKFINEIFDKPEIQKLERTELAYEINNSKVAQYIKTNVKATSKEIDELTRKTNILKYIWRILVINLKKEIGREESKKLILRRKEYLDKKRNEYILQKQAREAQRHAPVTNSSDEKTDLKTKNIESQT